MKLTGCLISVLLFSVTSLSTGQSHANSGAKAPPLTREFTVLSVNDIYNIEGVDGQTTGGLARLRTLRDQLDSPDNPILLLLAGDFLFPSSLSGEYQGEQMVDILNLLDGAEGKYDEHMFVTFGNHEFDKKPMKYAPMIRDRIQQSEFSWLGTNIDFKPYNGKSLIKWKKPLYKNKVLEIKGIKVGLFSITTNMAIPEYAAISTKFSEIAREQTRDLKKQGAEVVIALTHLKLSQDKALLNALGDDGPDILFGGHEHNRLHACVNGRCVVKADADARSAAIAKISVDDSGRVDSKFFYTVIDESTVVADKSVKQRAEKWLARYQNEYCQENSLPQGCLKTVIGKTSVDLIGEELEIRRYETNLGAYIADQMVYAFDDMDLPGGKKPQIALINSGTLRINQNIPAGSDINKWYLNAILQYPVSLKLITISGDQLRRAVNHSIEDWTGNGWWLQVSGLTYRHNVELGEASDLQLIDRQGNLQPVKADDQILAVVGDFIADPAKGNQDGYTMLNLNNEVKYGKELDLQDVVTKAISAQWQQGNAISPALPGRVCSSDRSNLPCVQD